MSESKGWEGTNEEDAMFRRYKGVKRCKEEEGKIAEQG